MLGPKLGHVPVLIPLAWFMALLQSLLHQSLLNQGVTGDDVEAIG